MQKENYPELSLDFWNVLEHLNTLSKDYEKIRYLRQYSHLLAVYAEHEPYQVESILSKLPNVFQDGVWDLYVQENEAIEDTKEFSEKKNNEKQKVIKKSNGGLHQMKMLIDKVDVELERRFGEPAIHRKVWYELRANYKEYDDEEIIDSTEPEVIHWYKYTNRKESMKFSTFKKNLSNVRAERKKK